MSDFSQVIRGKRYDTGTATMIASNEYWDGSNLTRNGRNTYLYETPNGNYFALNTSQWQGEPARNIQPLSREEAAELFDDLPEKEVESFPGVEVVDA